MAYIPWWQRMSPPTFAERFDLGGLAGRLGNRPKRVGFKVGSPQSMLLQYGVKKAILPALEAMGVTLSAARLAEIATENPTALNKIAAYIASIPGKLEESDAQTKTAFREWVSNFIPEVHGGKGPIPADPPETFPAEDTWDKSFKDEGLTIPTEEKIKVPDSIPPQIKTEPKGFPDLSEELNKPQIFYQKKAEMVEEDDHSKDEDVLEVKETFDKVIDLYNTGRSAEIDAIRSKEFAEKVKNIIDTKYGGTIRNLADDLDIERVRINSLFKKHNIKTDRSGNITQQTIKDLWNKEDKQFLKDLTTNAKYKKDYILDRVENSLGKDFNKDQWVNWKDLSEIWGLKHRMRVDQLKTDSTDLQARLNKLDVKKKKGKGKEVLWHLGDAIIKMQKQSLIKKVTGTGTWHNIKRKDFEKNTDPEGYKVEDQIKQDIRELTKDVLGENYVPYALEEVGHGVSINNQLSFEELFKDSNASWISSKIMQDPVLNKEILAARNSIEKGIENSERKQLLILEELLGKDFNQLTQKIAQDAVEIMNQRRTNVKTDPRLTKNKFLKDQADRVPLYELTFPKRGETFKSGFLNIDMSSIEPSVSVGKILEINPNAKSFSDLTKKQQELYKENLKNQYIDFATYYYKKRGLDNEDIKDLFDALTEGKEKTVGTETKRINKILKKFDIRPSQALDEQITIAKKYGDLLDDDLLRKLLYDGDPQHQAEVMATLDEMLIMQNVKGMNPESIIQTVKDSWERKKQATGGLTGVDQYIINRGI